MGGYKFHIATTSKTDNAAFITGLFAPDLLKKWYKLYGIEGTLEKYNLIWTEGMPDFEELRERIMQDEVHGQCFGMHYGKSSLPDFAAFWNGLSEIQKNMMFYRGYAWHLLGDLFMYNRLDIDAKMKAFYDENSGNENIKALFAQEKKKLHSDWDKTNSLINETYSNTALPEWIIELGVVNYLPAENLHYVDWSVLKNVIDYMRMFDPVNGDMEEIIQSVLNEIANN